MIVKSMRATVNHCFWMTLVQEGPLVDLVVLVALPSDNLPNIVSVWPKSTEVNDAELPFFTAAVTPSLKTERTVHYCFNTPFHYCFAMYFTTDSGAFSLVFVSSYAVAAFFSGLFGCLSRYFSRVEKYTGSASSKFDFAVSVVENWSRDHLETEIIVEVPGDEFRWNFSGDDFTFADYDASKYFDRTECDLMWKALFRGEPVLIVGDDSEMTTKAIFAAMSLMNPLHYCDPVCMWLTVTDPRFVDVVNEESDLKIVGTNCAVLCDGCQFFKYVFYLNDTARAGNDQITHKIALRMKRAVNIAEFMLDNQMLYDAACDIIESPMYTDEFGEELKGYRKYDLPTGNDFMMWEHTHTFRVWRRSRNTHQSFRDALLSNDPERIVQKKTKRQLLIILRRLQDRQAEFKDDEHASAVLKRYIRYVQSYLEKL